MSENVEDEQMRYSNRPKNTAFRQQNLPAWQPLLTAWTVLPVFVVIGIIFIPLGAVLIDQSNRIIEQSITYTNCKSDSMTMVGKCNGTIEDDIEAYLKTNWMDQSCECLVTFSIDQVIGDPLIYYGLTNFYQNHRRYVKSRSDWQLSGKDLLNLGDCDPYDKSTNGTPIAPCGAVANSMFNDSFTLSFKVGDKFESVEWSGIGIAWPTDKKLKFNNPEGSSLQEAFKGTVKPPNWQKNIWELDTQIEGNNGFENEDFIVWMRTAAFPNFRKLHRRIDVDETKNYHLRKKLDSQYTNGLPAGEYRLHIQYTYPVVPFKGDKKFIITISSWLGGKNPFLGYCYTIVGILSLVVGIALLVVWCLYGKSTDEMININNQTPYQ